MESKWKGVIKAGGISAYVLIVYSFLTMFILAVLGKNPETAEGFFLAMQENKWVAALRLDLLTVLFIPLYYLLFGSIYLAIKQTSEAGSKISIFLVYAGVTLFLATPSVFSMIELGDRYAGASTEEERNLYLAAGEAILASDMWHGTGAVAGGIFTQAGALILSMMMLRGTVFSRITAWIGIIQFGLDLLHIILMIFWQAAGVALMMVAGPLYLVWFFLVGKQLIRLGSE